uniref:Uncharacterized protein n=1 Tax=Chromera velia CCMP2878 TaxID=1169474 RepID=A0A0G4G1L7_9ALVE|eukprot:Cvel_19828.t1-p1 / transcript=Cvel_19828.t1 / gene=Cvel_19828 / organism=Chromera_velia_CCMP2878 / gene_product=hypothetical protein / transcript_product=hypothetical protein / location=Cvel_scaffold1735:37710-39533(-) / protein_length=443 / sequence_SO=supercontig / SO=protein_coding / is_pseudo=false
MFLSLTCSLREEDQEEADESLPLPSPADTTGPPRQHARASSVRSQPSPSRGLRVSAAAGRKSLPAIRRDKSKAAMNLKEERRSVTIDPNAQPSPRSPSVHPEQLSPTSNMGEKEREKGTGSGESVWEALRKEMDDDGPKDAVQGEEEQQPKLGEAEEEDLRAASSMRGEEARRTIFRSLLFDKMRRLTHSEKEIKWLHDRIAELEAENENLRDSGEKLRAEISRLQESFDNLSREVMGETGENDDEDQEELPSPRAPAAQHHREGSVRSEPQTLRVRLHEGGEPDEEDDGRKWTSARGTEGEQKLNFKLDTEEETEDPEPPKPSLPKTGGEQPSTSDPTPKSDAASPPNLPSPVKLPNKASTSKLSFSRTQSRPSVVQFNNPTPPPPPRVASHSRQPSRSGSTRRHSIMRRPSVMSQSQLSNPGGASVTSRGAVTPRRRNENQ